MNQQNQQTAIESYQEDQIALRPEEIDSGQVIRRVEAITRSIDGAVKVSLQRTNAQDWVKMGTKYYLQASGCQKIRSVWGIYFRDKQVIREDYPDGGYGYYVTGLVGSQLLDRFYGKEITVEADGGRSSNDAFFSKGNREPDPLDIRKAAVSNFEARAIASFLGLKNFTEEDLKSNGIHTGQVSKVEYKKGSEGGGNATLISEAQRKRLFAKAKAANVPMDAIKQYLVKAHKIDSTQQIPRGKVYDSICEMVDSGGIMDAVLESDSKDIEMGA